MQQQRCHFCGYMVVLIHVHGHYQCPVCNTNALPCCDGDNCDTNMILREQAGEAAAAKEQQLTFQVSNNKPF